MTSKSLLDVSYFRELINDGTDDFVKIKKRLEEEGAGVVHSKKKESESKELKEIKREETKVPEVILTPKEKEIKDMLKEESLEFLWRLCHEASVIQGLELSVHKGAIDAFAIALSYNSNETKWKYIVKIIEKLQSNESVIAVCSVLKKFLQQLPEGDIQKIRSMNNEEVSEELNFPKTRIELISKLDRDFQ